MNTLCLDLSKLIDMLSVRFKFYHIYKIEYKHEFDTYMFKIGEHTFLSDLPKLTPTEDYLNVLCFKFEDKYDYHGFGRTKCEENENILTTSYKGEISHHHHDILDADLFCVELTSSEKRFLKTKLSK